MPSSEFVQDCRWIDLGHMREAIRRRGVGDNARKQVWQLPGHGYPQRTTHLFLNWDDAGNWTSAIYVQSIRFEERVHDEFSALMDEGTYLYSRFKTRLRVTVETPPGTSPAEQRRAVREARRLARQLTREAWWIKHETKRAAVPLGEVRLLHPGFEVAKERAALSARTGQAIVVR